MTFWATKSEDVGLLLFAQLVSKIFNLCGHDPPTSQTDGQTDDMRSQYLALHYSASRVLVKFGEFWLCTWLSSYMRAGRQTEDIGPRLLITISL